MKKILLALLAVVAAVFIPSWTGHRGETSVRLVTSAASDFRAPAPHNDDQASIQGIGFVEPVTEVRKLVFKRDGIIARCPAGIGQACKKGEILIELDNREELAALAVARAGLALAESGRAKVQSGINPHQIDAGLQRVVLLREQVRYWQKERDRCNALQARGSVAVAELDKNLTQWTQRRAELGQAEAELGLLQHYVRDEDRKLADAEVDVAGAKLHLAQQHCEDTLLRAPCDGTMLELLKREGDGARVVDPEPVVLFGDTSRLRVRAEVDERYVAGLRPGQKALVLGRGLGRKRFQGRVVLVKAIMGKKTVFSRAATERKDLDVVQLMIEMEPGFTAPIGLEVDVLLGGSCDL